MKNEQKFDELVFFAIVKKRPAMFLGRPSLLSFRDNLFGMDYAFSFYEEEKQLKYFHLFIQWYHENIIKDLSGYSCWWIHILYTSGNDDKLAFESFFSLFERYLKDVHQFSLPEID